MIDKDVEVDLCLVSAQFVGNCPQCNEPTTGGFTHDEFDCEKYFVMECVNCHFKDQLIMPSGADSFFFTICGGDRG